MSELLHVTELQRRQCEPTTKELDDDLGFLIPDAILSNEGWHTYLDYLETDAKAKNNTRMLRIIEHGRTKLLPRKEAK